MAWGSKNGVRQYAAKITQKFGDETLRNGLENGKFVAKTQYFSLTAPIGTTGGIFIY